MKKQHIQYHKNGSIWTKGNMIDGECDGYWERFRKDGTKMRSGYFKNGQQVGKWITYDKKGQEFKVTSFGKK